MGYLSDIFEPATGSIKDHVGESFQHQLDALRGKQNFFDEMYNANWHFTQGHPGATATADVVENKWGVPVSESLSPIAQGAGSVFGSAFGPIGGAIGGGAAGLGLGSQFGEHGESDQAYRAMLKGAGTGVMAGLASQGESGGAEKSWVDYIPSNIGGGQQFQPEVQQGAPMYYASGGAPNDYRTYMAMLAEGMTRPEDYYGDNYYG